MALFMGVHDKGEPVSDEMVTQNWEAYKTACVKLGLAPKHAHVSAQHGKAFCITEAASADLVQQAHDEANVPVNEVLEVVDLQ